MGGGKDGLLKLRILLEVEKENNRVGKDITIHVMTKDSSRTHKNFYKSRKGQNTNKKK